MGLPKTRTARRGRVPPRVTAAGPRVRVGARAATRAAALVTVLAAMLLVALPPAPARAYVPSLQEIYALVAERQPPIQRAMIELRSYVFDPLRRAGGGEEGAPVDAQPPELAGRSFVQKVYWIRNAFLGIETYAEDGTPLHFYLHEGFRPVQGDLTPGRHFSEVDVVPPFLAFVSADPAKWRQAVEDWGLNPRSVDIARGSKGEAYYRLLETEEKALWLELELLRPVKLQTHLAGADGGSRLTIEFAEFMFIGGRDNDAENFYFPRTVNFLLDGRLFKQTVVLRFEADPSVQGFPITKLRTLAARVQGERPLSFTPEPGETP